MAMAKLTAGKVPAKKRGRPAGSLGKKKAASTAGKGRALKLLPPPIDAPAPANLLEENPAPESLLRQVENLFLPKATPEAPISSAALNDSSLPSSTDALPPMSAESLRLLASVPSTIGGGDTGDGGEALPGPVDAAGDEAIAALMAQVAFESQDVIDVLTEFFDWLAEKAKSDHWSLTERQARMLGRPLAQMLNASWAKLQMYLPDVLGRWCESTPGAMAFLMAAGLVIGPKLAKQWSISKTRRASVSMVENPAAAAPVVAAPLPAAGGSFVEKMAA